ncbi:ribonuclease Z [Erythrobacter sp. NAP1]|uniref:hypothetical protein n=1 Tax=Erythrobacter sp. NAP1 TaxID=237727 RepID=UPI0000686C0B|nr:hypothetical protein [Erythrobacter sp. NAP1]EAQ29660.1 ribonuclease Z [Erythrobacter sp. NAP1]
MNRFAVPFVLTGLFALAGAIGHEEPISGRRARGVHLLGQFLDWLLVEPLTLPGAHAFVFVVSLFFTLVFTSGGKSAEAS